ncbi:MAG: prsE 5 [Proteobacteria bacterium]|nr:prsE 5 [Pseudomonadota bacterium]
MNAFGIFLQRIKQAWLTLQNWSNTHFAPLLLRSEADNPFSEIRPARQKLRRIAIILAGILLWSLLFPIDIASHSTGEVIPASQIKLVQHLEGGIVRRIRVHEGQQVKAGDPVAEIDRSASESDLREAQVHLGGLRIRALRLEAQLAGRSDISFPPELERDFPDDVRNAREQIRSQSGRYQGGLAVQTQKVRQRDAESAELRARQTHLVTKLNLLRDQVRISEKLLKEGLTNQYEHLNLLKEEQALVSSLAETEASIVRASAAGSQERSALDAQRSGEREQQHKDLEETRRQMGDIEERLHKFSDSQRRLQVLAPIDGTVLTLNVVTEGGVLPPGGTLMSLVPDKDPLLIETQLPVGDVGFVRIGQKARIQLVSSSAHGFAPIDGTVAHISADRVAEPNREPYYRLRIRPDRLYFSRGNIHYQLVPGVRVSAAVLIGQRSVFNILTAPLRSGMQNALTEP